MLKPGHNSREEKPTLYGLFLWDGSRTSADPDDSSDFIREVTRFDGYKGDVKIINLTKQRDGLENTKGRRKKEHVRLKKPSRLKPVVHAREPLRGKFAVGASSS